MKKIIGSIALVATLVALMSTSVLAGKTWTKNSGGFKMTSQFQSHREQATVSPKNDCLIYASFSVKTNMGGQKTVNSRIQNTYTAKSYWTILTDFSKEGYVKGMVDKVDVTHTDK
ncbi:MAG: hypothetical protein IKG93_04105 [Clostridiales bacterium]|nr:hypothetical protein [Clostridiales bacterium]